MQTDRHERAHSSNGVAEVFGAFLKLGLTSFGGPIAHLGYFRNELVLRRKWLDEQSYADLVALCQFLPGPASSQVGFALGLLRGGFWGGVAAWTAFTLPSAAMLFAFAFTAHGLQGAVGAGLLHGLKLMAVAVVAQAVWGMARNLTPDATRATIALLAVFVTVLAPTAAGQIIAIMFGAIAGTLFCRDGSMAQPSPLNFGVSRRVGVGCLAAFFLFLLFLPLATSITGFHELALFDAFYRSGSLVFGGGHVVLPLLEAEVVNRGWVTADAFLAGYGATQAMPGPLFTFAAYLGAIVQPVPNALAGAGIALLAIFLPGILLLAGALPFWNGLRRRSFAQAAMRGANAAVVGILAAALYSPVWTGAVIRPLDFAVALAGFVLLTVWKMAPWMVVVLMAASGIALTAI